MANWWEEKDEFGYTYADKNRPGYMGQAPVKPSPASRFGGDYNPTPDETPPHIQEEGLSEEALEYVKLREPGGYEDPSGRDVFDNPISTSDNVQLEYSYRNVQVYIADQAPWWDELQYNSMRVDDATFAEIGSGNWGILSNHRVQMPAIVVEAVPRRTFTPYELGSISQVIKQDVIFHVVAESRWWRNQLIDVISLQQDKTLQLYDTDKIAEANVFPLDFRGMVVSTTSTYDALVNDEAYKFRTARVLNINITEMESYNINLHEGSVRASLELIL